MQETLTRADVARAAATRRAKFYPPKPPGIVRERIAAAEAAHAEAATIEARVKKLDSAITAEAARVARLKALMEEAATLIRIGQADKSVVQFAAGRALTDPMNYKMKGETLVPTVSFIVACAAGVSGFLIEEIVGPKRSRDIVRARQVACYVCSRRTGASLPEIGRRMGGRDHTTVLHAARTISKRAPKEPAIEEMVTAVNAMVDTMLDAVRAERG